MKEVFVIKILRKCTCGLPECTSVDIFYASVSGEEGDITESVFNAEKYDTYEAAKKMAVEIISINNMIFDDIRMELMFSIEKYFA